MQIVFLIKPYAINMYSFKDDTYTLLGTQKISHIENESHSDYENRTIYVCKDICQDFINTDIYKQNKRNITNIKAILTNPWCVYEIINLEKEFDRNQVIDQKLIDKMIVHKESENLQSIKNDIFNIALNGYNVSDINNQVARFLHLQYLSIYGSTNFLNKLKNTLDTIFHLHNIEIDSIYSHINTINKENKELNELRLVIEDQSLDISYIHNGKIVSTLFIPCGCVNIKTKIKESLHIDDIILDKILKSKSIFLNKTDETIVNYDKSLNNIWPDLSENVKNKIDQQININLEFMKIQIRNFIDSIDMEFVSKDVKINIYSLDENSLYTLGLILSDNLKQDTYMLGKLLTLETNIFTKKIF